MRAWTLRVCTLWQCQVLARRSAVLVEDHRFTKTSAQDDSKTLSLYASPSAASSSARSSRRLLSRSRRSILIRSVWLAWGSCWRSCCTSSMFIVLPDPGVLCSKATAPRGILCSPLCAAHRPLAAFQCYLCLERLAPAPVGAIEGLWNPRAMFVGVLSAAFEFTVVLTQPAAVVGGRAYVVEAQ